MLKTALARQLRESKEPHYNCCQSVLLPFCQEYGLDQEVALRLGENFGSGMRHGGTCGAISGALMVLGLLGKGTPETKLLIKQFRESFQHTACEDLLAKHDAANLPRKAECDAMVLWAVAKVEELLSKSNTGTRDLRQERTEGNHG